MRKESPASTGIVRVSSSWVLPIECTWLTDPQQVWAPPIKADVSSVSGLELSGVC